EFLAAFLVDRIPQVFRLSTAESAKGLQKLIDLFLENDYSVGVAENLLKVRMIERILFFAQPPGYKLVQLDRPANSGTDAGLYETRVVQVFRLESNMRLAHSRGCGLGDPDELARSHG